MDATEAAAAHGEAMTMGDDGVQGTHLDGGDVAEPDASAAVSMRVLVEAKVWRQSKQKKQRTERERESTRKDRPCRKTGPLYASLTCNATVVRNARRIRW